MDDLLRPVSRAERANRRMRPPPASAVDLTIGDLDREPFKIGVTIYPDMTPLQATGQLVNAVAQLVYSIARSSGGAARRGARGLRRARRRRSVRVVIQVAIIGTATAAGAAADKHLGLVASLLRMLGVLLRVG